MQIELNGQPIEVPEGTTILSLVERYQLSPAAILVERNALVLLRSEWLTPLASQDKIEFIKVVAGG